METIIVNQFAKNIRINEILSEILKSIKLNAELGYSYEYYDIPKAFEKEILEILRSNYNIAHNRDGVNYVSNYKDKLATYKLMWSW